MTTNAIINLIILSLICHGCFVGAIYVMMKAEDKKRAKASK
jgi:Na+-transporting NADH:ubiquinone oxidoreductase subunit NqrC